VDSNKRKDDKMKLATGLIASFAAVALSGYLYSANRESPAQRSALSSPFPAGSLRVEIHAGDQLTYQGVGVADTTAVKVKESFHFNDLCHGGAEVSAEGDSVVFSLENVSCPAPGGR
jgi:hypothetical protein